jgi:hypothetical protein
VKIVRSATLAFTEASTALSVPLSLQARLVLAYYDAVNQKVDTDDEAYVTKTARTIYSSYDDSATALRENIDLLARKMEIYIDWASDFGHDPSKNNPTIADQMNVALLAASDCDKDIPFANGNTIRLKDKSGNPLKDQSGNPIQIDWYSAKHHVVTIGYCFDDTHKLAEPVRQWASKSPVDPARKADMMNPQKIDLAGRLSKLDARLNAFMNLTMYGIDQVRDKYRPDGFTCHVPILREATEFVGSVFSKFFNQRRLCMPIRT